MQDLAENHLDGVFYGSFPSGNGINGSDFVAELQAIHNKVFSPQTIIGTANAGNGGVGGLPVGPIHSGIWVPVIPRRRCADLPDAHSDSSHSGCQEGGELGQAQAQCHGDRTEGEPHREGVAREEHHPPEGACQVSLMPSGQGLIGVSSFSLKSN